MRYAHILSLIFLLACGAKADPLRVTLGGDANVAFVTNYAAWSALSDEAKAAYAAAVFDQYTIDAPDISFIKPGDLQEQLDCVRNLKATPESLARLISNRYAKSPAERHGSPAAAITAYLIAGDFCATLTFEMEELQPLRGAKDCSGVPIEKRTLDCALPQARPRPAPPPSSQPQ